MTVVAGVALAIPAAPSQAARTQAAGCSGVAVVVDFASLGGGNQNGCAPGDPDSGVTALRGAGFEPTRAAQEAGYFVCRIDGRPANDPCQRASPADAYWSYWHATPGGSWTFSSSGAADHDPEPGTVDGWAFGDGDPPSSRPPAASQSTAPRPAPSRAPAADPTPQAPRRSPSAAPAGEQPAVASAPGASTPPTGSSPSASATPASSPEAGPSASGAASPSPSPSRSTATPAAAPLVAPQDGGSSPWVGVLLAAAVLALLGAAATRQAQRRR